MAVKHAKTLTKQQLTATLRRAADSRYPDRDLVMVLLSVKAGLRAGEIAKLTWPMVVDSQGRIASHIELHDAAAKNCDPPRDVETAQRERRNGGSPPSV